MNPAALATNLADLRARRHPDRQQGRLRRQGPGAGRLQDQSARRRQPRRLSAVPGRDDQADPAGRRRPGPEPEGSRPLPQLLRDGPGLLAVRPLARADAAVHRREVRQDAGRRRGQPPGPARPATTTAKRPRPSPASSRVPKAKLHARHVPQHHRQPGPGLGPDRGRQRSGCELFLGSYPITPASDILHELVAPQEFRRPHVPGRRRNRRHDLRHRRRVRRRDGRHRLQRPRHRAQGRRHRPGRDDRAAAADHQRAARRPEHRLADQDRTGRLAAGHVRPQRRVPGAGHRGPQPGRLLRRRSGSLADRRRAT